MIKVKGEFFKELIPDLSYIIHLEDEVNIESGNWNENVEYNAHLCGLIASHLYVAFEQFSKQEEVEITQKEALICHFELGAIIEWCDEFMEGDLASLDTTGIFPRIKETATKLIEVITELSSTYVSKLDDPMDKILDLHSAVLTLQKYARIDPSFLPGLKAALDEMVEIYNTEIKEELEEEVNGIMELYFSRWGN